MNHFFHCQQIECEKKIHCYSMTMATVTYYPAVFQCSQCAIGTTSRFTCHTSYTPINIAHICWLDEGQTM